jgi:hypothetical protein
MSLALVGCDLVGDFYCKDLEYSPDRLSGGNVERVSLFLSEERDLTLRRLAFKSSRSRPNVVLFGEFGDLLF